MSRTVLDGGRTSLHYDPDIGRVYLGSADGNGFLIAIDAYAASNGGVQGRSATTTVSAGNQTVTFTTALASNNWEFIKFRMKDLSGIWTELDEDVATKLTTGFTYNFPEAGTLSYAVQVRS